MKEVIHEVRKALISKLNGNVTLNGATVPIFNRLPSSATYPLIRIYSVSNDEVDQNQTKYITETITRLEVITRFSGDSGGELDSNLITDQVLELVRTRSANYIDLEGEGFKVFTSTVAGINYLTEDSDDFTYFRTIIELSNRIEQVSIERPFIFTVRTFGNNTSNDDQFELPLTDFGNNLNIVVDWGDGSKDTITAFDQAEKLHTFPTHGDYDIKITGTLQGWRFNNGGDSRKILNIKNWGIFDLNINSTFFGCLNMTQTATDTPTISETNLTRVFSGAQIFNGDVSKWNVSGVTNFLAAFQNAKFFNNDISNWDVSNGTNFNNTFNNAHKFNQDVSNWDVSNGADFTGMFSHAFDFNQPIGNWTLKNEGNVSLRFMLDDARSFDQSLANWNMERVNNLQAFLKDAELSTANYDATLIGWASQTLRTNVTCDFGNSQYTAGGAAEAARNTLINTYNWTITDGGAA